MDLELGGKTVIVTGGGSNIGRGIVLAFAAEGANVVNAEIDEEQGRKVVEQAKALGGKALLVPTDVTDWGSVQAMAKGTLEVFGRIDALVNNAGGTPRNRPFVEKPREEWQREIDLNYWGVINCIRAVVDHMTERRYGKIVNIASASGQSGQAAIDLAVYGRGQGGSDRAVQRAGLGARAVRYQREHRLPGLDRAGKGGRCGGEQLLEEVGL